MNELDAIRARRAAITPGVWNVRPGTHLVVRGPWIVASVSLNDAEETRVTAEFIAAAPADVDTLLAMVERMTGELATERAAWSAEHDAAVRADERRIMAERALEAARAELANIPDRDIIMIYNAAPLNTATQESIMRVRDWFKSRA